MQASSLHLAGLVISPGEIEERIDAAKSLTSLFLEKADLLVVPSNLLKLTQLKAVDLSHNSLSKVDELGALTCLNELVLSENILVEFPARLALLNLVRLDLSANKLKVLPNNFGSLTALTDLNISHNEIGSLPNSFSGLSSLEVADMSYNYLFVIADGFRLPNLRVLNLRHNQLQSLRLGKMSKFEIIDVQSNPVEFVTHDNTHVNTDVYFSHANS